MADSYPWPATPAALSSIRFFPRRLAGTCFSDSRDGIAPIQSSRHLTVKGLTLTAWRWLLMSMRTTVAMAAVFGTVAVAGAWTAWRPVGAVNTPARHAAPSVQGMKWTATLNSMNGSTVKGTASLAGGSSAGTAVASLSLTGGQPNATYPWHVHNGKCPAGGVFGGGKDYKPLKTGADGSGSSTANLEVAAPTTGDFHVNVHAPDMKSVVACGDLSMAM